MKSRFAVPCALAAFVLLFPGCRPDDADAGTEMDDSTTAAAAMEESAEITALRGVAAGYTDVNAALAAGYIPDPSGMCVTAAMEGLDPALGAMGLHYFRPDLLGITGTEPRVAGNGTHTDFNEPGVLIYEPQADGSLVLVAIENVVFTAGWDAAGNTSAPSYMGNDYVPMTDDPSTELDEAHGFEPHQELHIWIPRDNPNGMFAPFNPTVTCQHGQMAAAG